MKIADIYSDKSSEGSGRCPENLQRTSPLTHFRALHRIYPRRKAGKGSSCPFSAGQDHPGTLCVNRLSRHILTVGIAVCCGIPRFDRQPFRSGAAGPVFLYIQNGLLSKEDQKLPLAWHVIRSLEHVYLVEYFISRMFMWSQEVIVSHPESQVIVAPSMLSNPFVLGKKPCTCGSAVQSSV